MAKVSRIFICQKCGHNSASWLGKCPSCQAWDSMAEEIQDNSKPSTGARRRWAPVDSSHRPEPITKAFIEDSASRIPTGIAELDRTLGGGVVPGSFILVGGDPGIGKSTLLLQVAGLMAKRGSVLYVSGEESPGQIRMRGLRLGNLSDNLFLLPETQVELIESHIDKLNPLMVVIDSIQTIYTDEVPSAPGTVGQIRESAGRLLAKCKSSSIPMFLIGHVTKDGAIAGPRLLEHMVDTVLYFEGERGGPFRIVRGVKNRFGSTNEIGVFEMKPEGLVQVDNPSQLFLSERPQGAPGSVVTACVNGARPLLLEIQALVCSSHLASPRRATSGFDQNRLAILLAIIEKRGGYHLMGEDVFVNVAGGARIDEPAADLAVCAAVVSSFRDVTIDPLTIVLGEVGLAGETRAVSNLERRVAEGAKLGFTRAVIPRGKGVSQKMEGLDIIQVADVAGAMEALLDG
ncbi:MAG: DNA repair protein RadA [Nitrospinota bacterium]|nr:DNA repair protein RadA [Nitrospinota bacterium]